VICGDENHTGTFECRLHAYEGFDHGARAVLKSADGVACHTRSLAQFMDAPAQCSSGHPDLIRRDRSHILVDKITYLGMLYTGSQTGEVMKDPIINAQLQVHSRFRQRLLDEYPDLDDETIRDTLEGITNLHELISELIRSALTDEALQVGLRTRIEEMRARLDRLAERGLRKRQLALEAMNEVGLKKLEQPDFTASARVGAPPLVVTSEQSVPDAYWIQQSPKLDRQTLTSDLRRGNEIPGACLVMQLQYS
jgi:hypothetical protein